MSFCGSWRHQQEQVAIACSGTHFTHLSKKDKIRIFYESTNEIEAVKYINI